MDNEERVALIRRGNELFNQGDMKNSLKIFLATDYKDGIIRVGDYLYFDKKDKIAGVKLYKKAGHQKAVQDFAEKAASTIRLLLQEDILREEEEKRVKAAAAAFVQEWKPITLSGADIENVKKKDDTKGDTTNGSGR